jgi:hypothetical protein
VCEPGFTSSVLILNAQPPAKDNYKMPQPTTQTEFLSVMWDVGVTQTFASYSHNNQFLSSLIIKEQGTTTTMESSNSRSSFGSIMPVKKSGSSSTSSSASIVLGVPLSIHIGQFVVIALVMVGLRFDPFAHFVRSILSILPSGGIFAVKYAAPWFKPLSVHDWFVHVTTLIPNLEMIEWFRQRQVAVSKSKNNKNNTLYQSLYYLFLMSQVQAIMTLLSHSLIGVRDDLQVQFIEWEFFFMRLHVFSTGLLILLPRTGVVSWNVIVSVVIPLLAYLVNQDILTFQSVPGIVLSTLSMIAICTTPSNSSSGDDDGSAFLPLLFKLGWVLLAFMPVLFPDTSNDWGHTLGAGLLNVPLFVMAYGLLKSSSNHN